MFYNKLKKHALSDYTDALENLQITHDKVQNEIDQLNMIRQNSVDILNETKDIINTITNTPREIETHIKELAINIASFKPVESLSKLAFNEMIDAAEELIVGTVSALFNTGAGAGWRYFIFALRAGRSIAKVCDGNKKIAKQANKLTKKIMRRQQFCCCIVSIFVVTGYLRPTIF